jgi:hypothetical protein
MLRPVPVSRLVVKKGFINSVAGLEAHACTGVLRLRYMVAIGRSVHDSRREIAHVPH